MPIEYGLGVASKQFLDLSRLSCERMLLKDLHLNKIALSNLDLEPVVNA
jgi:hypothetical protein